MAGAKDLLQYSQACSVLYVEDDKQLRIDTLRLLNMFFKNIDVATDGKEGLDLFEVGKYDIVISDLYMPKIGGVELAGRIKEADNNQVVVILSAHDEYEFTEKLKKIGVSHFIFKPLDISKFIEVLLPVCELISNAKTS